MLYVLFVIESAPTQNLGPWRTSLALAGRFKITESHLLNHSCKTNRCLIWTSEAHYKTRFACHVLAPSSHAYTVRGLILYD